MKEREKARDLGLTWITGASGLIGNYLVQTAAMFAPNRQIRAWTRADLDLLDFDAVRRKFQREKPRLVIHCAALTFPPTCQADPDLARRLNVEVTSMLADLARDIPFVFYSSDQVFDGRSGNYDESATPNPLNIYGETKAAAEKIVLANPKHTVIRTSLNGGTSPRGDRGFNEQLRRAFERGQKLTLFTDEFRCPIPAVVTAGATWELVALNRAGLYHITGSERLSRWQMGELIAARWPQLNPRIEPESVEHYRGSPRPRDVSMNCSKAQKLLSFPLPRLSDWLAAHADEVF